MKMFKKVFAVVLCLAMLAGLSMTGTAVMADEAKTVVEGVRWFPCEPGRENDDLWEAECVQEGCGCQRFDDDPEETGNSNFVDTTYGEDGSLTIVRNGNDGQEFYWPRIRTIMSELYPELDITVADTLYFDIEATNAQWNVYLNWNGLNIKLGKEMAVACGMGGDLADSDADAPAGTYKGSINIQDALSTIAAEGSTESAVNATAVKNLKKTFVPQVNIFYVGGTDGSVKINSLYISTADDAEGAKCEYLDMGTLYGDEYYELAEEPIDDNTDDSDNTAGDVEEDPQVPTEDEDDKKDEGKNDDKNSGSNMGWLIWGGVGLLLVVVVAVVVVVVIIIIKKKK